MFALSAVFVVRAVNGAPAILADGKPITGLAFFTPNVPPGLVKFEGGSVIIGSPWREARLETRAEISGDLSVEARVKVDKVYGEDATAHIYACLRDGEGYLVGLGFYKAGNRAKFWRKSKRGWSCWFSPKFDWKPGQWLTLRFEKRGAKVRAFVNGKPIGERVDRAPLPGGKVAVCAYRCEVEFDRISVMRPDGTPILYDDFSEHRREVWRLFGTGYEEIEGFARAGVHVYNIPISLDACLEPSGSLDGKVVDTWFESVLDIDPEALFLPRVGLPRKVELGEGDFMVFFSPSAGKFVKTGMPSLASERWLKRAGEALRQFVRHVESAPYGNRVMGYHVAAGDCGEWSWSWGDVLCDYSEAQLSAFKGWLKRKYGGIERLRGAWGKPSLGWDEVRIPEPKRRLRGDLGELFDPKRSKDVIDYLTFHSEAVADAILGFARIVKEETRGRKLFGVFYGYHIMPGFRPGEFFDSGHGALRKLLESPLVDFICAPYSYRERGPGGACISQLPVASVALHGKVFYNEDDTRTFLASKEAGFGRCGTLEETIEVLKRNTGYVLSKGGTQWWMDLAGANWFLHPQILSAVGRLREIAEEALRRPRGRASEIAVIVSDESRPYLRQSYDLIGPLVIRQVHEQMARIGAPFDIYLASDIGRLPDYKLYIFLDTVYMSERTRRAVRERVLRDGHVVLWVFAPGLLTDEGPSVEAASEMTGMRLKLLPVESGVEVVVDNLSSPLTKGLPSNLRYGTENRVGPILYCDDPEAQALGSLVLLHETPLGGGFIVKRGGLAVKRQKGWVSVFSSAPNVPSPLLRAMAKFAGVHIYSDADDVVYANRSLLCLHARHGGRRRIRLPRPCDVVDAWTGEVVARRAREFEVEVGRGQTKIWWLEGG